MKRKPSISAYWSLVGVCLVEFYKYSPKQAGIATIQLRKRLRTAGIKTRSSDELIYHSEPIDVASELANQPLVEGVQVRERYLALRRKVLDDADREIVEVKATSGAKTLPAGFARVDTFHIAELARSEQFTTAKKKVKVLAAG